MAFIRRMRGSFRFNVIGRIVILAALLFLLLWSLLRESWDATPFVAGALLLSATVELIRYLESGTRDLAQMLRAVACGDFTTALPRRSNRPPFAEYEQASRTLISTYQRLDLRRAASDELLRAVIEHIGTAVLCIGEQGRIAFANAAARELLASTDAQLPARLLELRDNERTQLELPPQGVLLLHARRFTLLDEPFMVVACQDIREELEGRDVEAWQSLTRVLTHEMMNSLTPIMTLSRFLHDSLTASGGSAAPDNADIADSIEVIHERSNGLASFIQAYRQFANPPTPVPSTFPAMDLLERVARLMRPELELQGIRLDLAAPEGGAMIQADASQMEQILINLIRNAQDAVAGKSDGRIELCADQDAAGRVLIHVTDNGRGIAPELLDRIFVPFFTTRAGGTGIGLALSRQLARLNGGSLAAQGTPGACRFTLRLAPAEATSLR